jgi:hypothetical protein
MSSGNNRLNRANLNLGATGQFPRGKFRHDDKGQLRCAIGTNGATVIVDFGDKPITYLAMTADQAREFAKSLLDKADIASAGIGD